MSKEIFLTFDMDWANDSVLEDFLTLIESNNLTGTLNVTHQTDILNRGGAETRIRDSS